MTTIAEVYKLVKSGVPLADAKPEGSDLQLWESLIANYNPNKQKARKASKRRATSRKASKRTNYAGQVLARELATVELVKRVNSWSDNEQS